MMSNGSTTLSATTDGEGNFSVADAPSGYYKVWADLPPFRMDGQAVLDVREVGCGYKDIPLRTTSTIQGVVLDHRGRPAPKIPVLVRLKDYAEKTYGLDVATDSKGQFAITGLPDSDVYLSAGSDYPRTDMPYRGIYYPQSRSMDTAAALRLKPGEHRESIGLKLDAPLERTG